MRRGGVDQQGSTSRRLAERERVCRAQERAGQDSSDGATCLQQRVEQQEQVQHEQLPVASLAQSIGVSDDLYCYESYGCGQSFDNKDEELNGYGGERSMKRQRVGPQHEQRAETAETTCRPVSSEAQEAQLRVEQRTNQVSDRAGASRVRVGRWEASPSDSVLMGRNGPMMAMRRLKVRKATRVCASTAR